MRARAAAWAPSMGFRAGPDPLACLRRAAGMKLFFRFTVLKVGQRDLYRGKCIYLVRPADLGQPRAAWLDLGRPRRSVSARCVAR